MVWIAMGILFFIIVLSRKWLAEPIGFAWSNIGAFVLGYVAMIATLVFTCSHKYGLAAGILGAFIGAFFGGMVTGEDSGGGY